MNAELVHLSFYHFTALGDAEKLAGLREHFRRFCVERELKGTILLAREGVNAMVSGDRSAIESFRSEVARVFGTPAEAFKEGAVGDHAFARMLVKIKKEIISVGDPELKPEERTARRLSPAELKRWLDEGRPITLLDTRNEYEIEVGTFRDAQSLGLDSSRQFALRAEEHLERFQGVPVVTFCTGGIRCEKASALLLKLGVTEVYQLDGGILRYFEENGDAHFDGRCFVFDWRLAVDGRLLPAPRSRRSQAGDEEFGRHRAKKTTLSGAAG
jgi:UPF0176 protein